MTKNSYKHLAISLSFIALSLFLLFNLNTSNLDTGEQKAQVGGSLNDGLIAHYSFDEGSGSTLRDETGKNENGTIYGGASFVDGKFGKALSFNGTDSYASVSTSSALSGLTQFSISFWMKPSENSTTGSQMIFQRGSSYHFHGTIKISYSILDHKILVNFSDGSKNVYLKSCLFMNSDEWHHIVLSVSSGINKLYVDGVSCRPDTSTASPLLGDGTHRNGTASYAYNMNFGANHYNSNTPVDYYTGLIDDIRIFNRPISSDEVGTLFGKIIDIEELINFSVSMSTTRWPQIFGQVGAYGVNGIQQTKDFASAGLGLALATSDYSINPNDPIMGEIIKNNIKLVPQLTMKLYQICLPYVANRSPCPLSESDKQDIINSAVAIVNQSATDPNVVGYWVLDDYPNADIRSVLQGIHDAVVEANKIAHFPKATICGFGGTLDYKYDQGSDIFQDSGSPSIVSLVNFSPTACDIVAPYFYGSASTNDPTMVDWSGKYRLARFFSILRSKGWDQNLQPLMAVPHGFYIPKGSNAPSGYVLPTTSNLVTQIEAYCKAGAIAVVPYVWSSVNVTDSLSNNPSLLQGLKQGAEICRTKYWNTASATPTPVPDVTPTPTPQPGATPTPTPDPSLPTPTPNPNPTPTPTPTPPPPPGGTNGLCGTTLNSCRAGSYSDVEDTSTKYNWSCLGLNGGYTASCSQNKYIQPPSNRPGQISTKINYQAPTINIPTTTVDVSMPKLPSWLDFITAFILDIANDIIRGVKRTGEMVGM